MTKSGLYSLLLACVVGLGGCEGTKKQLGLERKAPDEFLVIKQAPLEMPSDYHLRPPRPGISRPQETSMKEQARETVFGSKTAPVQIQTSSGESALLQQAGADQAEKNIRAIVDKETGMLRPTDVPVAKRLFGMGSDKDEGAGSAIDAAAEAERLKKNLEEKTPTLTD